MLEFCVKVWAQSGQEKGFSPVWHLKWASKSNFFRKIRSENKMFYFHEMKIVSNNFLQIDVVISLSLAPFLSSNIDVKQIKIMVKNRTRRYKIYKNYEFIK